MKTKGMLQLLAPIAITIVWYLFELIVFGIIASICLSITGDRVDDTWEMLAMLPFDFEDNSGGAIFFYIVDLILIIIAEIWLAVTPDEEFR